MTTPNSAPHIHRTDELVAALPHLVGFHPARSLVVVWIGAGRVILTQRVDIPDAAGRRAVLGMRVRVVLEDGETAWVRPVHPDEAFLDDERISATSPLAIALMGARVGHTVWVDAPTGAWPCEVLEIDLTGV